MIAFVLLGLISAISAKRCTTVNGVAGACDLKLNQFTFAGSHNAGSGSFGSLWHWSGGQASSCWYRNQAKSITQQLQLGIRYFDFDVAYIEQKYAKGDFWEKGIVLVHNNAYSRSLRRALVEIEAFMKTHDDAVVIIRIKDVADWARANVKKHLSEEFEFLKQGQFARLNWARNPLLKNVVEQKLNIFVFVNSGIYSGQRYINELQQVESYTGAKSTSGCYDVMTIFRKLAGDHRTTSDYYQIQIDWYYGSGLCLRDLAGLCNGAEFYKMEEINKKLIAYSKRPVNLVMVDYVGTDNVRLADVVKKMNEYNVKMKDTFN